MWKNDQNIIVQLMDVRYAYSDAEGNTQMALDGVSLSIQQGAYIALLGKNGSGKSTLARLINVLEIPDSGKVIVKGMDTSNDPLYMKIRRLCGMVFQNPDNQIVGSTVEEDVAFGPENLGIPSETIRQLVDDALAYVDLEAYALTPPSSLSGGQKQKLAIAGVIAMKPEILILDESTAMLDPQSREIVLHLVEKLRLERKMTVIHITHDMIEASRTEYIYVLDQGKIALEGTPMMVFSQVEKIRSLALNLPVFADIAFEVARIKQVTMSDLDFSDQTHAIAKIKQIVQGHSVVLTHEQNPLDNLKNINTLASQSVQEVVLQVKNLSFSYQKFGPDILKNINFSVHRGEILAVVGQSGSGKTTLISHLNGLIKPQCGEVLVYIDEKQSFLSTGNKAEIKKIRQSVGLLFQYPEYQLFEETVAKDISFGPVKMGMKPLEIEEIVKQTAVLVGLDLEILSKSPFSLSGGQKRRVALAGVLAMNPNVLVLDEPSAGLDPLGRQEIMEYVLKLKKLGKTIILVSHSMDDAARYADKILVLKAGKQEAFMPPRQLFSDVKLVEELGLKLPEISAFLRDLKEEMPEIDSSIFSVEAAAKNICAWREERQGV